MASQVRPHHLVAIVADPRLTVQAWIVAFSQTDFTENLKKIAVPMLVMHGDDDQIVPYPDSAPLSAKLPGRQY